MSLDPATGKTLWAFQEPLTPRHEYSMRSNHGKGVAYAKINGKGVVLVTTPGFFLHALDAKTGKPIEGWGEAVPVRRLRQDRLGRHAEGPHRRLAALEADRAEVAQQFSPLAASYFCSACFHGPSRR